MYYADYVAWLKAEHASITFQPGVTEIGPLHNPTVLPGVPPWNMDWLVKFPDGKQVYLYERWRPRRSPSPSTPMLGERFAFSFHYGTSTPLRRLNGFPARDKTNHPAIIRIDLDLYGPHLHFHGELPHIQQANVRGMTIGDVGPFDFIRAVLKHRETGADFDAIMNFTVVP